ncbi:hypothetical protein KTD31_00665 [Burkholderia multivorans]|uniref:hypothetical protein n=1 Tax=Burkholderia multivorans TaxID=87883 RepID=UPI001C22FBE0|nr:hypothetical protein [Burkholderia multivorans]MBU9199912.1 hypothetical protein [Burkholderia multivorans]MDN8078969.1 hypothetical protein [Burkholderia multivorans]
MSYSRVIPRDLFNEANLLKCYGRLYLNLEKAGAPAVELVHDGEAFDVQQDDSSGAIFVANVKLKVRGVACKMYRPLNSREAWPLYLALDDDSEIEVFNEDGDFSVEMLEFLKGNHE